MIKYCQINKFFDVTPVLHELQQFDDAFWKLHFQVKHYSGNWSALPLRSIGGDVNNTFIAPNEAPVYADTIFLQQCPSIQKILSFFECELLAVRLLKLAAGTIIHEHKDADLCVEDGLVRFHIPIQTNNKVSFNLDGTLLKLDVGSCWYMNFTLPHALKNEGNDDRIHLVIDAFANEWVQQLFTAPQYLQIKESATPEKFDVAAQLEIIKNLRLQQTPIGHQLADDMEKALQQKLNFSPHSK